MTKGNPLPPEVDAELRRQLNALLEVVTNYTNDSIAIIKKAQPQPANPPQSSNHGGSSRSPAKTVDPVAAIRGDISTNCKQIEEQIGVITKKLDNLATDLKKTTDQSVTDRTSQNSTNSATRDVSIDHLSPPPVTPPVTPLVTPPVTPLLTPPVTPPVTPPLTRPPAFTTVLDDIHWIVLIAIAIIFAIAGWWQVIYGTSAQPTPMERLIAIATDTTLVNKVQPILQNIAGDTQNGDNENAKTLQKKITAGSKLLDPQQKQLIAILFQHFIDRWRTLVAVPGTADTDQKISKLLGCPYDKSSNKPMIECQAKMVVYALENWPDIEPPGASSQVSTEVVTYTDPKSAWDALIKSVTDSGPKRSKLKPWFQAIVDFKGLCLTEISDAQYRKFKSFSTGAQIEPIVVLKGLFEYIAILECRSTGCDVSTMKITLKLDNIPAKILQALNVKLPQSFRNHGADLTKPSKDLSTPFMQAVVAYNVLMRNSSLITTATQPSCSTPPTAAATKPH